MQSILLYLCLLCSINIWSHQISVKASICYALYFHVSITIMWFCSLVSDSNGCPKECLLKQRIISSSNLSRVSNQSPCFKKIPFSDLTSILRKTQKLLLICLCFLHPWSVAGTNLTNNSCKFQRIIQNTTTQPVVVLSTKDNGICEDADIVFAFANFIVQGAIFSRTPLQSRGSLRLVFY